MAERQGARIDLQTQILRLFRSKVGLGHGVSPTFRDFHPESGKQLQKMMQKFVDACQKYRSMLPMLEAKITETEEYKQTLECAIEAANDALKERINPHLVKMALGIFLTHSKEAQKLGVVAPALKEDIEFNVPFFPLAAKTILPTEPTILPPPTEKPTLLNPTTADTLKNIETLSYWREDYDLNDHHYHWHLVYPWSGIPDQNKKLHRTIARQGELFLYMHSQMLARYNAERIIWSDSIGMVDPWSYDEVVEPSYTPPPGLRNQYGARPPLKGWLEQYTPYMPENLAPVPKDTMICWRNNINRGIIEGFFHTKKGEETGKFFLTESNAMNWVGIVVESEASELQEVSPGEFIDSDLYGSLHNLGHDKFGEIGYQEYTSDKNRWGVMGFTSVAVRDPVFWIWHRHIDDFRQAIVKKYKQHNLRESAPSNVKITGVKILPRDENSSTPKGSIVTYLTEPQLELHEVNAKLNHEPYKWEVKVETTLNEVDVKKLKPFTVRIFIAPKQLMHEQRRYIEMDKFSYKLTTTSATIERLDIESSVARKVPEPSEHQDPRCLCGWPQNMMLPSGTPNGIDYVAFAILTDDIISEDDTQSMSFCGAKDDKYPDPRGMGYPFDKTWFNTSSEMYEAVKGLDHVKLWDFKIYRETKLYQGKTVTVKGDISWENTIKYLFTAADAKYMKNKYKIDLTNKEDVIRYRMFIYGEVEDGMIPVIGGKETKWSDEDVAKYEAWIDAGYP